MPMRFEGVPGGRWRLGYAVLVALACCGLAALAWPLLSNGGLLPAGLLPDGIVPRPGALPDRDLWPDPGLLPGQVAALGGRWLPVLAAAGQAAVVALPLGLLAGLAMPARGPGAVLAALLLVLPLGLDPQTVSALATWIGRALALRPSLDEARLAGLAWQSFALVALLVHAAQRPLADADWQAARLDGLGRVDRLRWLLWPRLRPALLAGLVLVLLLAATRQPDGPLAAGALAGGGLAAGGLATGPGTAGTAVLAAIAAGWLPFAVLVAALEAALSGAALRDWPLPPAAAPRAPLDIAGRSVHPFAGLASAVVVLLPLAVLAGAAAGGVVAGGDLIDLLLPSSPSADAARALLAEPAWRREVLVNGVSVLGVALLTVALAWPAAWALSRLPADGPAVRSLRSLLLVGALWPGPLPLASALALAVWALERGLRRRAGSPVRRGEPDPARQADEVLLVAGGRPGRLGPALADPALRTGLACAALGVFALLWRMLDVAGVALADPAGSIQSTAAGLAGTASSRVPGTAALTACRGLIAALPVWLVLGLLVLAVESGRFRARRAAARGSATWPSDVNPGPSPAVVE